MGSRNESGLTIDDLRRAKSSDRLATRFQAVRRMTERLARPLSPEDCQVQSMPDASPVKWHLAHTTWFFETFVLNPFSPGYQVFDPSFSFLFNSYYNAVGDRLPRPRRGLMTRPTLDEVYAYRPPSIERWRLISARPARIYRRSCRHDRTGTQSRAAAPGIDPHRYQARTGAESTPARLCRWREQRRQVPSRSRWGGRSWPAD